MFTSEDLLAHLSSPIIVFLLLLTITHLVYLRFFKKMIRPTIASGSIIMALSVFALYVIRQLNFPFSLMLYLSLEILIIGLYMGLLLLQGILEDEIRIRENSDELAIGTWVTAIVFIIILLNQIEHTLLGFIALLSIIGFSLTAYFLYSCIQWYLVYFRKQTQLPVNGMILMLTVSLQAIAILLMNLFHDGIPSIIYKMIILTGLFFYIVGIVSEFHYLFVSRSKHFLVTWNNENVLNHGALSITGLAMILTGVFPDWSIILIWYVTLFVFIGAEIVDLIRFSLRFKKKNLTQAIGTYHPSQWMRLFTFGLFYAFNLHYIEYEYPTNRIATFIVAYGQYVIAVLLLIELYILFKYIKQKELMV